MIPQRNHLLGRAAAGLLDELVDAMDAEGLSTLLLLSSEAQPLNPFTAAKPVRL